MTGISTVFKLAILFLRKIKLDFGFPNPIGIHCWKVLTTVFALVNPNELLEGVNDSTSICDVCYNREQVWACFGIIIWVQDNQSLKTKVAQEICSPWCNCFASLPCHYLQEIQDNQTYSIPNVPSISKLLSSAWWRLLVFLFLMNLKEALHKKPPMQGF